MSDQRRLDDKWYEELKAAAESRTDPLTEEEIKNLLESLTDSIPEDFREIVSERKTYIFRKLTTLYRKLKYK